MELKILDYLIEHGGHTSYGDILNTFSPILETAGFLRTLKKGNFITGDFKSFSNVSITLEGRAYHLSLQQQAHQRAAELNENRAIQKQNYRFNKQNILIALSAAIFTFLSLVLAVYNTFSNSYESLQVFLKVIGVLKDS